MEDAPPVVLHGALYVLASVVVQHNTDQNGQRGFYYAGYAELLRLRKTGCTRIPLGPGGPKSGLELAQVRGAILAAGSACA